MNPLLRTEEQHRRRRGSRSAPQVSEVARALARLGSFPRGRAGLLLGSKPQFGLSSGMDSQRRQRGATRGLHDKLAA